MSGDRSDASKPSAGPESLPYQGQLHSIKFVGVVAVNCCQVVFDLQPEQPDRREFEFRFGSGAGIRTLNVAINRSRHPVQKEQLESPDDRDTSDEGLAGAL